MISNHILKEKTLNCIQNVASIFEVNVFFNFFLQNDIRKLYLKLRKNSKENELVGLN